jgi:hypothetical protein
MYDFIYNYLHTIDDYNEKSNDQIFDLLIKNEVFCEILNNLNKKHFLEYLKQLDIK